MSGSITIRVGDERPAWQPTITVDGASEDYSSGHTFDVQILDRHTKSVVAPDPAETITGGADGTVTVQWSVGAFDDVAPGQYFLRLRIRRSTDDRDLTVETILLVVDGYVDD